MIELVTDIAAIEDKVTLTLADMAKVDEITQRINDLISNGHVFVNGHGPSVVCRYGEKEESSHIHRVTLSHYATNYPLMGPMDKDELFEFVEIGGKIIYHDHKFYRKLDEETTREAPHEN